jgi:hypothetical protein
MNLQSAVWKEKHVVTGSEDGRVFMYNTDKKLYSSLLPSKKTHNDSYETFTPFPNSVVTSVLSPTEESVHFINCKFKVRNSKRIYKTNDSNDSDKEEVEQILICSASNGQIGVFYLFK